MAKAASFAAFIALVAAAEKRLIAIGQRDPVQRLVTLRGVYYGTTWSLDYDKEKIRSVPGATSAATMRSSLGLPLERDHGRNQHRATGVLHDPLRDAGVEGARERRSTLGAHYDQ